MSAATFVTGASGEFVTETITCSAVRVQQPHVTHVGGHAPSSRPGCSNPVHGSAMTSPETPEALKVSKATMIARAKRRTNQV